MTGGRSLTGRLVRETHEKLKVQSTEMASTWDPLLKQFFMVSRSAVCMRRMSPRGPVSMQVGNKDVLNCYYAHAEDSLQVLPASTHSVIRRPLLAQSACDTPFCAPTLHHHVPVW